MTEKKEPHQKISEDNLSDDEPIIELTEEVVLTDKDRKAQTLENSEILSKKAADDQAFETDEGITAFGENLKADWHDDLFPETGEQVTDGGEDDYLDDAVEEDAGDTAGDEEQYDFDRKIELDYEHDRDAIGPSAMDEYAEDDDRIDIMKDADFGPDKDEEGAARYEDLEETTEFYHDRQLADDNESLSASDNDTVMEPGDDLISLADFDDDDDEIEEDIIEITEFDHHYSEDDEDILEHAGMKSTSGLGDEDFLELFELEDENPTEKEEMRKLSESEEKAVEEELNRLLDDTLEDDALFEEPVRDSAEESSRLDTDWSLDTSAPPGRRFDHSASLFSEDAESEYGPPLLFSDDPEDDERPAQDPRGTGKGEPQPLTPGQIDMAIERVINEKFADRIEEIIYEVIEKTVLKEIGRLKESLLEDDALDDDI